MNDHSLAGLVLNSLPRYFISFIPSCPTLNILVQITEQKDRHDRIYAKKSDHFVEKCSYFVTWYLTVKPISYPL